MAVSAAMWQFSLSVAGDGKVVAGDGNSVCLVVVLVVILVAIVIILYLVSKIVIVMVSCIGNCNVSCIGNCNVLIDCTLFPFEAFARLLPSTSSIPWPPSPVPPARGRRETVDLQL